MSEINEELKKLKKSLERLDNYTTEIGSAKDAATSVVEAIGEVQNSYSTSIKSIDTEVSSLVETNKPLIEKLSELTNKLDQVDFPSRLDKIDATVAGINQGVMNLQGKIDNTERDLRDQLGKVSTLINEFERKQEAAQVHRKKEILLNRNILIGVGILVVAVLVIYILR
jgi:chromosome segregation ATPase